jgi:hypothetical protein
VELRFDNGRGEITVQKDARDLVASADILFNGTGLLIAAWEVDGRTLAVVQEFLTFGSRAVVATPGVPPLPTFEPGRHELTLKVLQPATTFAIPTVSYYVEGASAPGRIALDAPLDGASTPTRPVTFAWQAFSGVASYRLEIFEDGRRDAVFTASTRDTTYAVPRAYEQRFAAQTRYTWHVTALDEDGRIVAVSPERRLTW